MNTVVSKLSALFRLARLHQPIALSYITLPCWWGVFWARAESDSLSRLFLLSCLLTVASVIMRTAGCIYNDILDRNIDRWVKRTKDRPLVTKQIKVWQALLLFVCLSLLALLMLQMFSYLVKIICIAGAVLVLLYPLAKRVMKVPQLLLGFAFNLGALVGYVEVAGSIGSSAILLYIAGIYWTMVYDTIYAYQDREYDIKIGVNSSAVLYGSQGKKKMIVFTVMMTLCLLAAGVMHYNTVSMFYYFIVLCVPLSTFPIISSLDLKNMGSCAKGFKQCAISGFVVLLAILVARVYI